MLKQLLSYTAYVAVSSVVVVGIFLYHKQTVAVTPVSQQGYGCVVHRVIDGDSVIAVCHTLSSQALSIRLRYIDAPELSQIPWGEDSKIALTTLLARQQNQTQIRFNGQDVYQRYLGELFVDGQSVNQTLVKRGKARVYRRYHPPPSYISAMQTAKQQQLGIWQKPGLQQNPQRYRRLEK